MLSHQFNTEVNPGDASANTKFKQAPELTKKQLLKRNSFPHPDQNRHIDAFIKATQH